jgi:hypothetical protein
MEGEVLSWLSEQVAEYLQTESLGTTVSNSLWGCAVPYQGESRIQSRCPERGIVMGCPDEQAMLLYKLLQPKDLRTVNRINRSRVDKDCGQRKRHVAY